MKLISIVTIKTSFHYKIYGNNDRKLGRGESDCQWRMWCHGRERPKKADVTSEPEMNIDAQSCVWVSRERKKEEELTLGAQQGETQNLPFYYSVAGEYI